MSDIDISEDRSASDDELQSNDASSRRTTTPSLSRYGTLTKHVKQGYEGISRGIHKAKASVSNIVGTTVATPANTTESRSGSTVCICREFINPIM